MKIRAVTYTNRNTPLSISQINLPVQFQNGNYTIDPTKILVKVKLAALNPVDLFLRSAALPYIFRAPKGFGSDYSGDIVAIGPKAESKTSLSVDDKVCGINYTPFGMGTLAEYILVDPFKPSGANIAKIPETLNYEQAASYPLVFSTAQAMFDQSSKIDFSNILILGGGTSVGRYLVQLAREVYGAKNVVVTCSPQSEETMRKLGATEIIDYTREGKNGGLGLILQPVLEITRKIGKFDLVLDSAGNGDLFSRMEDILILKQDGGTYVTIVGDSKPNFHDGFYAMLSLNFHSNLRTFWSKCGGLLYKYVRFIVEPDGHLAAKTRRYFEEKEFEVFIDSVHEFADFQKGVDILALNKARGKVVINVE